MSRAFPDLSLARSDPLQTWYRRAVAITVAHARGQRTTIDEIARSFWGAESVASITKAAVSPHSTTSGAAALAGTAVGTYLKSLRPRSAAVRLFEAAAHPDMDGLNTIIFPVPTTPFTAATFVQEGEPIPVGRAVLGTAALGPVKKLPIISVLTGELASYSAESAEAVIRTAMEESAAVALDAAVFGTAAASPARPAGLLQGVTPLAATTGGGANAMVGDLEKLVGAIADAGGGASVMLFANPRQAIAIGVLAGSNFTYTVIPTPALAAGTIVAVDPNAIASGFSGLPDIDVSRESTLHFEDAAPLALGTAGAPNTVAAPVKNMFAHDLIALKLILRCAWTARGAGFVQVINLATW